jgi:ElaB/YqjD/DUF883 family membrane-anchored ribosome-binding protein
MVHIPARVEELRKTRSTLQLADPKTNEQVLKEVAEKIEIMRETLRRTDVEIEEVPGARRFDDSAADCRSYYMQRLAQSGLGYEHYALAFRFGHGLAPTEPFRSQRWRRSSRRSAACGRRRTPAPGRSSKTPSVSPRRGCAAHANHSAGPRDAARPRVAPDLRQQARELGTRVRDHVQGLGTQVQERAQELGAQVRHWAQEVGGQLKESAQEARRQAETSASQLSAQGREAVGQLEKTLVAYVRAKPLQSLMLAAGVGMVVALLWRK